MLNRVIVSCSLLVAAGFGAACRQAPPSDEASGRAPAAGAASTTEIEQWQAALTVQPRTGWVATASVGATPGNAIDGSATTRWTPGSNQATNQWFQIDLGAQRTFTAVRLDTTTSPNDYPRNYKVQVANDTTSWGTAPNVATGSGTSAVTLIGFASQSARYIRITLTGSASVPWSIYEVNVYDAVLPRTSWVATASINNSNAPLTVDGSTTTRWNTGTTNQQNGQSLTVDMASPQTFNQIVLDTGSTVTTQFPRGYNVTTSSDGSTFGPSIASGAGTGRFTVINFTTQQARYVRITLALATTVNTPWSVEEINVSGQPTVPTTHARPAGVWVASALSNSASAGLAIDNNTGTSWTSATPSTNQWFQVDMGTLRTFTQVVVDAGTTATARTYQLQVGTSSTGPWTTVISGVSGTAATVTINVPARTSRFIRINQTATSTAAWPIRELNVSGPALSRPGWVATASVTGGTDVAANAIDGVATTRWTTGVAQANGQNFVVDMGAIQTFNQLTLDAGTSTGQFPVNYLIEVNNEGGIWTPVTTGTGNSQFLTINFVTHAARYIRVTLTAGAASNWSIHELNVWRIAQPCDSLLCTASDQCHVAGTCDPNTGVCSNPNANNGTTCTDSNACTTGETCQSGMCTGGSAVTCPADQCHSAGTCNPATGCSASSNSPDGTACDDGNACTEFDECNGGTCQGSQPHACVAPDTCHAAGTCDQPATPPPPPSTQDLIGWWKLDGDGADASGGGHALENEGAVRAPGRFGFGMKFDGSTCMTAPIWDDARMQGGSGLTVMAWVNANDPAGCPYPDMYGQRAVIGRGYDYSIAAMCMFPTPGPGVTGAVRPGPNPQNWGWGGASGFARPEEWVHMAITWDHQGTMTYLNGRAVSYWPAAAEEITDWDPRFTIGCMIGAWWGSDERIKHFVGTVDEALLYDRPLSSQEIWSYYSAADPCPHQTLPDDTACFDGDWCTPGDKCSAGTCVGGPPITCTAPDPCHDAPTCVYWAGCYNPLAPAKPDGATCNDGDACTQTDTCQSGACTGGNPLVCSAPDECHAPGTCSAPTGVCSNPLNHDTPCSSSNADILGFEDPGRWAVSSGTDFLVQQRTQGSAALAIASPVNATLVSDVLTSNGPELFGIAQPTSFLVDLFLPQQAPLAFGSLDMFVTSVSRDVLNESLGHHDLASATLGGYSTWEFAFPSSVIQKLTAAPFNDLRVTIVVNVPFDGTGQYSFDNLRLKGPVTPVFECVTALADGTHRALFGYQNASTTAYYQPIGPGNVVTPELADRGQPTSFNPGTHTSAFSVDFTGSYVTWEVRGQAVTATPFGPPCAVSSPTLTPILECVRPLGGNHYKAMFGYDNGTGKQVTIPVSSENRMLPQLVILFPPQITFDRGQPTTFKTGRHNNVFSVDYNESELHWDLAGSRVTASASAPACPPPPATVQPILQGIQYLDGTRFKAFFGYQNNTGATVEIPLGVYNKVTPGAPQSAGQNTFFKPGRRELAFAVESNGGPVTWTLAESEATATRQSALLGGSFMTVAPSVPTKIDWCHELVRRIFIPPTYEDFPDCRSSSWELCLFQPECCLPKPLCAAHPVCLINRSIQTAAAYWAEGVELTCESKSWEEELLWFTEEHIPAVLDGLVHYLDFAKVFADPIPNEVRAILQDLIAPEELAGTADSIGFTNLDTQSTLIISGDNLAVAVFGGFEESTTHALALGNLVIINDDTEWAALEGNDGFPTPDQFRAGMGSPVLKNAVLTLVHELVHSRQYRLAGFSTFIYEYLTDILRVDDPHDVPAEREARHYHCIIRQRLDPTVVCN